MIFYIFVLLGSGLEYKSPVALGCSIRRVNSDGPSDDTLKPRSRGSWVFFLFHDDTLFQLEIII